MDHIEKCLKNAQKYSDQFDDYVQYKKFLKDLKELVDNKDIDESNIKNPFTFLLLKLPEKYHKYINMMYKDYFKKMSDDYKNINSYYLGESLLSDDGKIIVPISQNDNVDIDEFGAYLLGLLYFGGIHHKLNNKI